MVIVGLMGLRAGMERPLVPLLRPATARKTVTTSVCDRTLLDNKLAHPLQQPEWEMPPVAHKSLDAQESARVPQQKRGTSHKQVQPLGNPQVGEAPMAHTLGHLLNPLNPPG